MADTAGAAPGSGLEARVARLETDVGEIRAILNRLAPRIDEMYGFMTAKLPELATKVDLAELRTETKAQIAELRTETKTEIAGLRAETKAEFAGVPREMVELRSELRLEILQRPTTRQSVLDIFAIVG
jgi:hypothetical protein